MESEHERSASDLVQSISDRGAWDARELMPLVYRELRAMAQRTLRSMRSQSSVGATDLLHEAYLRIADAERGSWENRRHLFFAAARAMRDILVERRRRKEALKRGGDRVREDEELDDLPTSAPAESIVALAEVLERIERESGSDGELVRLRFFEGLTNEETASRRGVSLSTVEREWRVLRARLQSELGSS